MRVRLRFAKLGKVRWTSHRDVARMFERAVRRTSLPIAYTGGFTPRPKISFGLALPTGHESVAEFLDVEFETDDLDAASLPARLSLALPVGVDVTAAAVIDASAASLQEQVTSCCWDLEAVGVTPEAAGDLIDRALAAPSLVITRERKGTAVTEDVRPSIRCLEVIGTPGCAALGYVDHVPGALLRAELATQPRTLRPAELLTALSPGLVEGHVRRVAQWIARDGARIEPLAAPAEATDAPHALGRAS